MPKKSYQPRLTEIASQMGEDVGEIYSRVCPQPVRNFASAAYQKVAREAGTMFFGISILPCILPSLGVALAKDSQTPSGEFTRTRRFTHAENIGGALGLGSLIFQLGFYVDHPGYLAIPAAANALNGMWEWGKYAKSRLAQRTRARKLEASV